jgi:hypothetical protein
MVSREFSASLRIFFLLRLLPQHFTYALLKCELFLHLFSYQDIQNICVPYFHKQNISSHLLCLFLFLWLAEKCFCQHIVSPVNFLLFQDEYEVSFLLPWDFEFCPRQLPCLYSDFYLNLFDLSFGAISLQPLGPFDKHLLHSLSS